MEFPCTSVTCSRIPAEGSPYWETCGHFVRIAIWGKGIGRAGSMVKVADGWYFLFSSLGECHLQDLPQLVEAEVRDDKQTESTALRQQLFFPVTFDGPTECLLAAEEFAHLVMLSPVELDQEILRRHEKVILEGMWTGLDDVLSVKLDSHVLENPGDPPLPGGLVA